MKSDLTSSSQGGSDAADLRINFQMQLIYKKWGLSTGYALGLANEDGGAGFLGIGSKPGSYSRYFQAGILYRLSRK